MRRLFKSRQVVSRKLFKSRTVEYRDAKNKRVPNGTSGARKVIIPTKNWYGRYKDPANGKWITVALCPDKMLARQMLEEIGAKLRKDEKYAELGIKPETVEHHNRPLAEHLDAWERYLQDKGSSKRQVDQVVGRARMILDGCRFTTMDDLNASVVFRWLADRRTAPAKDEWPISKRTSNHYLSAIKGFSRWLVKDRRAKDDPLAYLSGLNPDDDIRHARRDLMPEDFDRFIEATRAGKPFRGLAGADRAILYLLAANTGLRRNELASLTTESFELDATTPTVTVEAGYSKHRRRDVQPLRADVAEMMKSYLKGRRAGDPVWPSEWVKRTNDMVKRDLKAAKTAWVNEATTEKEQKTRERADRLDYQDAGGRFFDFHSLRHQFISNLARGGVHPKVAQTLARHSKIDLTMNVYTHMGLADTAGALDCLPALDPSVRTRFATFSGETRPDVSKAGEDGGEKKTA